MVNSLSLGGSRVCGTYTECMETVNASAASADAFEDVVNDTGSYIARARAHTHSHKHHDRGSQLDADLCITYVVGAVCLLTEDRSSVSGLSHTSSIFAGALDLELRYE